MPRLPGRSPDRCDITYVATAEGGLYLAVILDLFSRRVVGWKLEDRLDASLVHQALQNTLILRQPKAGLYFHSDRGCQYSSHLVRKPLELIGAISSMSALGNCYDNAKAGAFFSTLKSECFPLSNCFSSQAQARSTIFEYIEVYYNNQRLHSALGYKSPRQYESHYQPEEEPLFRKKKLQLASSVKGAEKAQTTLTAA
jgi:putative transposase